ncbi:MAG: DUF4062 domain-containing protein [Candidatus Accumulibacter sp.]|uniref:DUF4062 domain-containing protein n=1 Tax=Accumulibacter sp. TaxID=2053492 RepID=UPI002878F0AF|nr:DUF4062 domain-containing protein [Accumulibacter sp.]MDS4013224.1 DUF4062 domain-containing protein [Accumulibacter sp.]
MKLYLSSTLSDLEAERQAVKEALSGRCTIVESYEADSRPLGQSCMDDVQACDVYLGIVGLRYGFVPPGQSKSITELEFDAAWAAGRRCYLFLKEEDGILAKHTDSHTGENGKGEAIAEFRRRLLAGAGDRPRPALFADADDLMVRVLRALWPNSATPFLPLERSGGPGEGDGIPLPPEDATALQRMLHRHLYEHWSVLATNRDFSQATVFEDVPRPLTPDKVFALACEATVVRLLTRAPKYFSGARAAAWYSTNATEGVVCSAFLRIVLVAAERHFRQEAGAPASERDPVLETSANDLVAQVKAAARFGFGLCLRPGESEPANVFQLCHPVAEYGNPGEQGFPLTHAELWAAIQRRKPIARDSFTTEYLRERIADYALDLGATLVAAARPEGRFAETVARCALREHLEQFEVKVFFPRENRDQLADWVRQVEDDLRDTLARIFSRSALREPHSAGTTPAAAGSDAQ